MESGYARQLQDILLSWDYWDLGRELEAGRGPISELPSIPSAFSSVDVSHGQGAEASTVLAAPLARAHGSAPACPRAPCTAPHRAPPAAAATRTGVPARL